jgi:hypothetical protein
MRVVRPLILLAVLLTLGTAAGSARSAIGSPTGLHGFLLRADEPLQTTFSRTPSFAWNPVQGALHYEFELSLSNTFHDNSVIYADLNAATPVEAPAVTLPWITGSPHSLYARVRAITPTGATPWSNGFGFDMAAPAPPTPLTSYPGLLRWSPVEGALAYQVWLVDAHKVEIVTTNTLDEREFYTFHQASAWTGTVRWRIRALRSDTAAARLNGIPAVQYGPWSPVYSGSNPTPTGGQIKLVGTVSDVVSDGSATSAAHRLMPAFLWSGNQTLGGTAAELFRVYVYTDAQCLNRVFTSAVVGTQAYSARPYGPLALPASQNALTSARGQYLSDGTEPAGFTYDGESVSPTESLADATPTTAVPAAPGQGTAAPSTPPSSSSSAPPAGGSSSTFTWTGRVGAPTDLWDTDWPRSGYYWTVVPVAAQPPGGLSTSVGAAGSKPGDTVLPVTNSSGFNVGDSITVGAGGNQESVTITAVSGGQFTLAAKLAFGHGGGEAVTRGGGGNLVYQDLELPQDVCAAGRVMRFGKESEPSLTSSGDLFATGLSSSGRLTSALHTTAFYGQPLVSWTPALGAEAYEVQWSKTRYPFVAEPAASGGNGFMTASTSVVLPVGPGVWWYRVRGFDYSLPTGAQQMSWSDPARLLVAKPSFKIIGGGASSKSAKAPKAVSSPAAGMKRVSGDGFGIDVPANWQRVTLQDSIVTLLYRDPTHRADVNVLRGTGRAGRSFTKWSADLAAQLKQSLGVTPSASIVTLPAGKAVRLIATTQSKGGPSAVISYYVDGGSSVYVVTFAAVASAYPSYAATFGDEIASFRIG